MSVTDLRTSPTPTFPPLFTGCAVTGRADPFQKARAEALMGCDAGLVVYNLDGDALRAAVVFTPEQPLATAVTALVACGVSFQNALGALAPPEVSVHLTWPGEILVNGARCGRLRITAATADPAAEPAWLVVGLDVPLRLPDGAAPGEDPGRTALSEEGCIDVDPVGLLESWVRHSLLWITRWSADGPRALHREWRGLARGIGERFDAVIAGQSRAGIAMGVDEAFGLLLRTGETTRIVPLTDLLEDAP